MSEIPTFICILFVIICALAVINSTNPRFLYRTKRSLDISQSLLTIFAICAAGYWYFIERTHYPHANVEQKLDARAIGNDMAVVQAELLVKNDGKTLLSLQEPWSIVQIVDYRRSPFNEEISIDVLDNHDPNEWPKELFDRGVLRWPTIKLYDPDNLLDHKDIGSNLNSDSIVEQIKIEPEETHRSYVEFIVPCAAGLLAVTSGAERPNTRNNDFKNGLHSSARGYVDLNQVCRPNTSSKEY